MKIFQLYDHKWGKTSQARLVGVLPSVVQVITLGIRLCRFDGTILDGGGLRTEAQAQANVDAGTGILDSLHRKQKDGFGHAADPVALTNGKVDWNNIVAFREMFWAQKRAAAILRIPTRQGADWNMNGIPNERGTKEYDWPHLEHPEPAHMPRARLEMERYRAELSAQGWDLRPENYV